MKEIIVATGNEHKLKEIKEILKGYTILGLKDVGFKEEIDETGKTFEENALIKANALHDFTQKTVIADDTGLCVDYLNGAPGVYSARYAGEGKSDKDNRDKLLREMSSAKEDERNAKFVCAIAIVFENGESRVVFGEVKGKIGYEEKGENGFGYDSLFVADETGKTFGEMDSEEKNKISHRKRAVTKALEILEKNEIG